MDPRLNRIEEKLTFVEQQLADLDAVVRDLGDTLDRLARRLDRLSGEFHEHVENTGKDADDSTDSGPTDDELREDRPPHW